MPASIKRQTPGPSSKTCRFGSATTTPFTRTALYATVRRESSSLRNQTGRPCPVFKGQQHIYRKFFGKQQINISLVFSLDGHVATPIALCLAPPGAKVRDKIRFGSRRESIAHLSRFARPRRSGGALSNWVDQCRSRNAEALMQSPNYAYRKVKLAVQDFRDTRATPDIASLNQ